MMASFFEPLEVIRNFLEVGGAVLWGILFLSVLLWALVIERYWFISHTHRQGFKALHREWRFRRDCHSWRARQIRKAMLSERGIGLQSTIPLIASLTKVLPLMGLLGTVRGMVATFDAMTRFGAGHTRGVAIGISEALVTTMAGLLTALFGLYFSNDLKRRVQLEQRRMAGCLGDS